MKCETYYLNLLYGRGNFYKNFNSYIKLNDGSGYQKVVSLCNTKSVYKKAIFYEDMFSQHFCGGLMKALSLNSLSIDKLSSLSTQLLMTSKNRISEFLNSKLEFEYQILTKNYSTAENILTQIYQKFGMSLWLLDSISILQSLSLSDIVIVKDFSELEKAYYGLFDLKNNIKERHGYYIKKMKEMINCDKFSAEQVDFLQYILFVSTPNTDNGWLNVIKSTYEFSFIDMYLALEHFLLRVNLSNNQRQKECYDYLLEIKSVEGSALNERELNAVNSAAHLIKLFDDNKFKNVISSFFSNESDYYNYFGAYKLVALSYIFSNENVNKSDVLSAYIVYLMCLIIKKHEANTIDAINSLLPITRLLRTFQIQKGLCLFIEGFTGYNLETLFSEQFSSEADCRYLKNEFETANVLIFPCKSKMYKVSDDEIFDFIENYDGCVKKYPQALYYFKEIFIKHKINICIKNSDFIQAAKIFVLAYAENQLLVIMLNPAEIVSAISNKMARNIQLSIEELCYIFIDNEELFVQERRNCFLNYFDQSQIEEPLDLINNKTELEPIVLFFLDNVCNKEMLPNLYRKFKSTEEVENYRLKICELLLEKEGYANRKDLMSEAEKISKTRALSKKLKAVEKSRVTINTDFIKSNCYDEISEEVDAYNVTEAEAVYVKAIINGIPFLEYTNNHNLILKKMYNIYAREFCFGDHSIDLSLSTRVRHGAFSNQILRAFTDNNLTFNGHGRNEYFNKLIEINTVDAEICKEFLQFSSKIKAILDYFTQHTLKVVLDKPIEGAIFRYDLDDLDLLPIYNKFSNVNYITFDDVAFVLNDYLIRKTNEYLTEIKSNELPALLKHIIDEIDLFSSKIKRFIINDEEQKNIERLIVSCKTEVQNTFEIVSGWFSISEYNDWENYDFKELLETCHEIAKSLFAGFDNLSINCEKTGALIFKGNTFRDMVDIVLIILNNAILHSGYKEQLHALNVKAELTEDTSCLYLSFVNNLSEDVDLNELDQKIDIINKRFSDRSYLKINTRQEGGMGLYKIMHTLFSVFKLGNGFFVSRHEDAFRVEINIQKEILINEKNINS